LCEVCGESLPAERLEVRPRAVRCVQAQTVAGILGEVVPALHAAGEPLTATELAAQLKHRRRDAHQAVIEAASRGLIKGDDPSLPGSPWPRRLRTVMATAAKHRDGMRRKCASSGFPAL
jgi:hypothetical protein